MDKFKIEIKNFLGGFCPSYWKNDYPSYGNRNMAARMKNIDLSDPNSIRPGPGLSSLAGSITTLIRSIMKTAYSADRTYAIGGAKLYNLSHTTVIGTPTTLGGTSPEGEDVKYYHSDPYYTYNHSTAGEMGKGTDVDFLSTVPTGKFSLAKDVPHPLEKGGDDILYIGNGHLVSTYDKTNDLATESAIDLPDDCVVVDIKWYLRKLYITVDNPRLSGDNRTFQSIYIWDTVSESWDNEIPQIRRSGGMLKRAGGILFIFYEDITAEGEGRLGYIDGSQIIEVCQFDGSLPAYYQISEKEGFICWISDNLVYCWGSGEAKLPARTFQLMQGKYATIGGIGSPFGTMLVASTESSSYDLSEASGYQTDSNWKGMLFPISQDKRQGVITKITINTKKLAGIDKITIALVDNKGATVVSKVVDAATYGAITKKIFRMIKEAENIRVELDYSGGSATTSLDIRSIIIEGHLLH